MILLTKNSYREFAQHFDLDKVIDFIYNSNAIEFIPHTFEDTKTWINILLDPYEEDYGIPPTIYGQFKALCWALMEDNEPIDLYWLHRVHILLMTGLIPGGHINLYPGILRQYDVPVPCSPAYQEVPLLMSHFFDNLKYKMLEPMSKEEIYHIHCMYETIHPYPDGNGRSGRILWQTLLHRYGHPFNTIKFLNREDYIDSLNACRKNHYLSTTWYP
jgi:Fic family protein